MKKRILFSIALLFFIVLTSCSNIDTSEVNVESKNKPDVNTKADISDDIGVEESNNDSKVSKELYIGLSAFVPDGWHLLDAFEESRVIGDLNKDGIQDVAFVIEGKATEIEAAPRMLFIVGGNKNNSYSLLAQAKEIILRADEGGIMGDPFMGLSIDRGSLLIHHYGGSAWRWSSTYRFRYQEDGFYLIGATEDWFHAASEAGSEYEDFNLLTGDYIRIETDDNGIEKETKSNRGKNKLINLVDFDTNGERQF